MKKPNRKIIYKCPVKSEEDAMKKIYEDIGYNRCFDDYDAWLADVASVENVAKIIGDSLCEQGQWHYSDYGNYADYVTLPDHLKKYCIESATAINKMIGGE